MEEVIKKIIQIEEQAQSIIKEAIQEKERKEKEHEDKIQNLHETIINNAHKKVEQIREREFEEINEKKTAMEDKCQARLSRMQDNANQQMDQWVNELVNRVLG
jgi:vacuolar-type H+-ATPase subunit H